MKKRVLTIVAFFILVLFLFSNLFLYQKLQKAEEENIVLKVIDGNTFILQTGQRIRLGNLYAPEPEFCGGKQAKEELENLILGKKVKLDIFSHGQFNRPLASGRRRKIEVSVLARPIRLFPYSCEYAHRSHRVVYDLLHLVKSMQFTHGVEDIFSTGNQSYLEYSSISKTNISISPAKSNLASPLFWAISVKRSLW